MRTLPTQIKPLRLMSPRQVASTLRSGWIDEVFDNRSGKHHEGRPLWDLFWVMSSACKVCGIETLLTLDAFDIKRFADSKRQQPSQVTSTKPVFSVTWMPPELSPASTAAR